MYNACMIYYNERLNNLTAIIDFIRYISIGNIIYRVHYLQPRHGLQE